MFPLIAILNMYPINGACERTASELVDPLSIDPFGVKWKQVKSGIAETF